MGESMRTAVDGEPPELIIVYYSAGADVNIHTSGHFPFVYMHASPQLMEYVEEAAHFCQNWGNVTHLSCHLEIGCNSALLKPPGDTKDLLSNAN